MKQTLTWSFDPIVIADCFEPVRDKLDAMLLVVKALKLMLVWPTHQQEAPPITGITLVVGNMSRLFIVKPDKVITVAFPFTLRVEEGVISFGATGGAEIDSLRAAQVTTLLTDLKGPNGSLESFGVMDMYLDDDENSGVEAESIVRDLLLSDDGYLRYDRDVERANGVFHPEMHIDAFYTNRASVKLGLYEALNHISLRKIIEADGGCYFLAPHREL